MILLSGNQLPSLSAEMKVIGHGWLIILFFGKLIQSMSAEY